jgi:hypothetical protein
MYTLLGLFASFTIFATMRSFAGPAPHTMTREWQEQANEYLKVRYTYLSHAPLTTTNSLFRSKKPTPSPVTPPRAGRARDRSSPLPRATNYYHDGLFPLLIETSPAHDTHHDRRCLPLYKTELEGDGRREDVKVGDEADGLSLGLAEQDSGSRKLVWCIYCTTTTMQHLFLESHHPSSAPFALTCCELSCPY